MCNASWFVNALPGITYVKLYVLTRFHHLRRKAADLLRVSPCLATCSLSNQAGINFVETHTHAHPYTETHRQTHTHALALCDISNLFAVLFTSALTLQLASHAVLEEPKAIMPSVTYGWNAFGMTENSASVVTQDYEMPVHVVELGPEAVRNFLRPLAFKVQQSHIQGGDYSCCICGQTAGGAHGYDKC